MNYSDNKVYKNINDLPMIGIGTGGLDYNSTYNSVLKSLEMGYRLIDTAENYYNEEAIGNAIIDSGIDRNEIIIISKYFGGAEYGNPHDVITHFNTSLQKLKTNYIDIYLVHMPCGCIWTDQWQPIYDKYENYKKRISVWLQFIELKKQNYVNYIGVSNWTLHNINELVLNKLYIPDIIQIEWCPSYYDMELYEFCINHFIRIIGYGLFSRNDMNHIKNINTTINKSPNEILLKWCMQRNIIAIPRSKTSENMFSNLSVTKEEWILNDNIMNDIDNFPQIEKGHALKRVYDNNYNIQLWKPIVLTQFSDLVIREDYINNLIQGNISCIHIKQLLTTNKCNDIIHVLNNKSFDNYNTHFRFNEIGITIDNMYWRENPEHYWNECNKINELFEKLFDFDIANPFNIMIDSITKIAGNNYSVKRMENNGILCPKGVFRIFTPQSCEFPYHTDGFNYGELLNHSTNINRCYPVMNNTTTNSVIAIIFVLQNSTLKNNEIDLYNCLVDDLELYRNEIGMYSHWMGTKYTNQLSLENILMNKSYFSPLLNKGDLYIFSASRIHKLHNHITSENRIVLATFALVKNNEIILYQ